LASQLAELLFPSRSRSRARREPIVPILRIQGEIRMAHRDGPSCDHTAIGISRARAAGTRKHSKRHDAGDRQNLADVPHIEGSPARAVLPALFSIHFAIPAVLKRIWNPLRTKNG